MIAAFPFDAQRAAVMIAVCFAFSDALASGTVEIEAESFARSFAQESWLVCGDSWIHLYTPPDELSNLDEGSFVQILDPELRVRSYTLRDVHRANGIEWKGSSTVSFKLYRTYERGEWSPWREWIQGSLEWGTPSGQLPPVQYFDLQRKEGKWSVEWAPGVPHKQDFKCGDVPASP